jgi:drug/metabolite transporter (DMT)-like permease
VAALLVPVFATLIDWAVFGQLLSAMEMAGIALVLIPAALIARAESRHSAALTSTPFRWQRARAGQP